MRSISGIKGPNHAAAGYFKRFTHDAFTVYLLGAQVDQLSASCYQVLDRYKIFTFTWTDARFYDGAIFGKVDLWTNLTIQGT